MTGKKRSISWWLLRIAAGLFGLLVIILLLTTLNASIRDRRVENAPLPDGSQLVDIGGSYIHVHQQGMEHRGPTVIFVGCFGCNSAIWQAVQPDISKFARTIAFDPAGYAWSDPGPTLTPQTMADDLYATLTALDENSVILVGFSAGMLPIYDFYTRYSNQIEVEAIVSVEGAILDETEGEWYQPENPSGFSEGMTNFLIATGLARPAAKQFQGPMPDTITNVAYYELVSELARTRTALRTWASQYSQATHDDVQLLLNSTAMPTDVTVFVLQTEDILDASDALPGYEDLTRRYAQISVEWYKNWVEVAEPDSQLVIVPDSTHFIMFDQPQAVIEAVRNVAQQ
ncbi:alpha/beta fold hydrolase [Candidatus Leptofilum sp.]|uniref:alpha/beta fold hydrolase n=1 Tax=Candidatus Leptofilum sp. TaxID=3241576 RepID=UPI003B5AB60F